MPLSASKLVDRINAPTPKFFKALGPIARRPSNPDLAFTEDPGDASSAKMLVVLGNSHQAMVLLGLQFQL